MKALLRPILGLVGLLASSHALAQQVGGSGEDAPRQGTISPPAERLLVSPSGVDMRAGQFAYSQTDLAIGEDNESGGLQLTRTMNADVAGHANPFANFSHNWDIMVTAKGIDIDEGVYNLNSGPDLRVQVHFGGRSETFDRRAENSAFEQASRNGYARLTYAGSPANYVYTYTTGDGMVAVFRPLTASGECSSVYACAYASSITNADGTRLDFTYDPGAPVRLRAITSNRGYALLLQYGTGSDSNFIVQACLINLTLQAKPANNVCPASPQASTSYGYTSFESGRRLASVVDANAQTWSFTYGRANGALTMGFLRPGDAAPWFTNSMTERANNEGQVDELVDTQSFVDGSVWNFARDYSPQVEGEISQVAGGRYQDPAGNWTTIEYGFFPRPASFNPPRVPNQGYPYINYGDVFFQMTPGPVRITDPLGRATTWDYCDPNAMANLPAYEHDRCLVFPMPVAFTEPDGRRTDLLWDMVVRVLGRSTRHARAGSDLADIVTRSTYECLPSAMVNCFKPTTTTDARGAVTEYAWDSGHGGLLSQTGPAPTAGAPRPQIRHSYAQRYAWVSNGAGGYVQAATPVWVRTATSSCRTSAQTGNPAAPCATADDEVRTQYDYGPDAGPNNLFVRGQVVTATDAGVATSLRSCYTYDARGRRIGQTQPNANLGSCPATQTSAQPFTANQRYDAMDRVTGTISASPDDGHPYLAVRTSYDPAGRPIKVETGSLLAWQSETVTPASWNGFTVDRTVETGYDAMGRKTRETLREGSAGSIRTLVQYSYDIMGRLECTAVRMNPVLFGSLPASACTPGTAGSDGPDRISRNVYDAAGQRLQLREGVGTADEGTEATWAHDANGRIVTLIDGNGNRAELRYDGHGRQDRWAFPSATRPSAFNDSTQATALATSGSVNADDYEAYGYDANGNRTSLRQRDNAPLPYGNLVFEYDALNRLTRKTVPERLAPHPHPLAPAQTRDVFYGYDLRSLQLFARFDSPSGEGVTNAYDGFGRLASTTANADGVARTLAYQYDRDGNRIRITHPDGNRFEMDYDGLGRPITLWANETTAMAGMWYYPTGLPSARSPSNGAYSQWGYDGVQRVSWVQQNAAGTAADMFLFLGYNPASQIASRTLSNDSYAWTGHYAVNRAYTTNGLNQYTQAGGAGFSYDPNGNLISDSATTFTYDVENRLVAASGARNATLAYDPLGRLSQITAADGTVTRFLYDGDALVAEYDGAGVLIRRYVHWGAGTDVPFLWYEGATLDSARYLNADQQGSIILVSDQLGIPTINRYDEYGIPAAGNLGRFQYTGQVWLAELGMYHYKARVYSPTLGRFLQIDPIGYDDQFNLYAYVGNDPINRSDPTGRWSPRVHELLFRNVLRGRANEEQIREVINESQRQDTHDPGASNLAAHHLRARSEAPAHAMGAFNSYVNRETAAGRQAHLRGDDSQARIHFTHAGHAIADAYSPMHRDPNGDPRTYLTGLPTGSLIPPNPLNDALMQGHSPWEGVGGEDLDALARSGAQPSIQRRLDRLYRQIFGPPRSSMTTGTHIPRWQ